MTNKPQAGFTLIEVLLVSALLAFLALATFSAVRSTINTKEDVDLKTEVLQGSRAVLSIMDRDLRFAFLLSAEDLGWFPAIAKPGTDAPPPAQKPVPPTIFQGEGEKLFFSSKSHQRLYADSFENEDHFVTYQLVGGDLIRAESVRAVSLKDRESPDKFKQFVLIPKVKVFKLEYWDDKSDKWTDRWDTDNADYQNRLPQSVHIHLEYEPDVPTGTRRKVENIKLDTAVKLANASLKSDMIKATNDYNALRQKVYGAPQVAQP